MENGSLDLTKVETEVPKKNPFTLILLTGVIAGFILGVVCVLIGLSRFYQFTPISQTEAGQPVVKQTGTNPPAEVKELNEAQVKEWLAKIAVKLQSYQAKRDVLSRDLGKEKRYYSIARYEKNLKVDDPVCQNHFKRTKVLAATLENLKAEIDKYLVRQERFQYYLSELSLNKLVKIDPADSKLIDEMETALGVDQFMNQPSFLEAMEAKSVDPDQFMRSTAP